MRNPGRQPNCSNASWLQLRTVIHNNKYRLAAWGSHPTALGQGMRNQIVPMLHGYNSGLRSTIIHIDLQPGGPTPQRWDRACAIQADKQIVPMTHGYNPGLRSTIITIDLQPGGPTPRRWDRACAIQAGNCSNASPLRLQTAASSS